MAAYGSFHRIFENPRQNNSTKSLLDTLSSTSPWNPSKGLHLTTDHHDETPPPFTEIFGELHFRETSHSSYEKNSTENSSLQLCTEGLGSESYYGLEDEKVNGKGEEEVDDEMIQVKGKDEGSSYEEEWEPRGKERREYPPAMTRMSFKTYRKEGRLVLEEVRIPRREFLRASREDGRLKLKLVQPEDDDHDELEEENEKDKHEEEQ
ncbi:PREDICTED: protein FANTASTIC FOUR 3 [Camelina sativa]|uniref:Protein FANTASTIC FOUR 3 n=1 Tax=Camelina sativa TaxID=90675 RepID=A0ABM0XZR1_CAMSA|nr:PREDICTED: protein FANTASTIC FOUR 3 [Camelina sativa]